MVVVVVVVVVVVIGYDGGMRWVRVPEDEKDSPRKSHRLDCPYLSKC